MPTPQEYMELRAPTFYADANRDDYISQADDETGTEYCNSNMRNKAIFLLAAHWMELQARNAGGGAGGAPGAIKGAKEGQLSLTFGTVGTPGDSVNTYLGQTVWGVELDNLQKSCFIMARTRFV